jgi:hypothetical protein
MPSLFVVITKTERPQLCVSQKSLPDTISNLKCWSYSHSHQMFIYEPRILPSTAYGSSQYGQPKDCAELAMIARLDSEEKIEHHQFGLGHELDQLPYDQALLHTQEAIDYLQRKMIQIENKFKVPEEPNAEPTTGLQGHTEQSSHGDDSGRSS